MSNPTSWDLVSTRPTVYKFVTKLSLSAQNRIGPKMHLTLHTEPFIYQEKVSISITGPIQTLNIELEVNAL